MAPLFIKGGNLYFRRRARSGRSSPTVLGPQAGRDSKNPKRKVNTTEPEDQHKENSVDIYDYKTGSESELHAWRFVNRQKAANCNGVIS